MAGNPWYATEGSINVRRQQGLKFASNGNSYKNLVSLN